MRKVRRDDDDDAGLDSLLDTMTNVVGILVLVLIMTQLGVSETLNEITSSSDVTQADVDEAELKLKLMQLERERLDQQVETAETFDIAAERERLKRMKELLETRQKLVEDESKEANEFALAIQNDRKTAERNQKEIAANAEQRKELEPRIAEALEERAALRAKLDRMRGRSTAPAAKVVTIPNPRPAPNGARQVVFVCAGDRLFPVNLDEIRKDAELRAKQIIVSQGLNRDPKAGIDPKKFAESYTKLKSPVDDFLTVEYSIAGNRWPQIRLIPKENAGANDTQLRRSSTPIRKLLAILDPSKYYARFYVLPDSFNVYLTARKVLTDKGMLAGWEPQGESWVFTTGIGGGIELGPPRPPTPPGTTPARPSKPANVID